MNFHFNKEHHIYTLDNTIIPSVTQVLPRIFFNKDPYYMELGSLVHSCIELYNKNDLIEDALDPVLTPYLEAYKSFIKENGKPKGIVDVKTGVPQSAEELQLAGYALLVREGLTADGKKGIERDIIMPFPMHCLYLSEEGKYKLSIDYSKDYRKNREIFLSFLTVFKWRQQHGYTNRTKD